MEERGEGWKGRERGGWKDKKRGGRDGRENKNV